MYYSSPARAQFPATTGRLTQTPRILSDDKHPLDLRANRRVRGNTTLRAPLGKRNDPNKSDVGVGPQGAEYDHFADWSPTAVLRPWAYNLRCLVRIGKI